MRFYKAVSQATEQALASGVQQRGWRRGRRTGRPGVPGPGDPDPSSRRSDLDGHKGVASCRQLAPLRDAPYRLGRCLDPTRGPGDLIGLPEGVLDHHAAVIGPTGSGKTKSVLVPWAVSAVRAGHSVVMLDVAGDLLDDLAAVRRLAGPFNARVAKWDFTDPAHSLSWNWLAGLADADAAVSAAEALLGRERPAAPSPVEGQRDRRVLWGLLELVRGCDPQATPQGALHIVRQQADLHQLCQQAPPAGSAAIGRLSDVVALPPDEYSRAVSGVVNVLDVFDQPGVAAVTRRQDLILDQLLDQPTLLIAVTPLHGSRTSEMLASLLLSQVMHVAARRSGRGAGKRLFLMVDEAPWLRERVDLERLLSVSRRVGITVCLTGQDVAHFGDEAERSAVLSTCGTYISLPTASELSAEFFLSRLGTPHALGRREVMDPPGSAHTALVHCPPLIEAPFLVDLTRPDL